MVARLVTCAMLLAVFAGCAESPPPASTQAPPASPPAPAAPVVPEPPKTAVTPPAPTNPTLTPETATTPPAETLVSKALQSARAGNIDAAIPLIDQALEQKPTDRRLLLMAAQITQQHGAEMAQTGKPDAGYPMLVKSAEYLRKLRAEHGEFNKNEKALAALAFYNEACAYARDKQTDKAMASLNESFELGFEDLSLLDTDADLDSLRELPEFKKLKETAPERLLASSKEHAKELIAAQQPFDFTFELPDLDGKTVSLADYKGKVVIADFWGTWCPPCRKEIPHFVELQKKYRDAGLEVVGLNYERGDAEKAKTTIKEFAEENGINYPCLIGDKKTQEMVPNFQGYPTTVFIDRTGKVRLKVVGYHSQIALEGIVLTLLAEGAEPTAN